MVDWLAAKLCRDRVEGYKFTPPKKAARGSKFLSTIETGRFKYWVNEKPLSDSWWFFRQAEHCIYYLPPGGLFEKHLKWHVPDSEKISTPKGRLKIHDDRLISATLVSIFDDLHRAGRLNIGLAKSAIVPPIDPLEDISW